jgi:hypothetical protein
VKACASTPALNCAARSSVWMRTPLKLAPKRGSMKLRTLVGSGAPPERLDWMSAVIDGEAVGGEAAGAAGGVATRGTTGAGAGAGDADAAARWIALRHTQGDDDAAPQAHRCTTAAGIADTSAAAAGAGIRMTAEATAVASRSAGSYGDETARVDWRWTGFAKSALP